jgi:hypothetical protein
MRRMGWSWQDYSGLPVVYVPPLLEYLRKEDTDRRRQSKR